MAEQWHEHLGHLSWWEQIDRWFFPSHYSCTGYGVGSAWEIFWSVIFFLFCFVGLTLFFLWYFSFVNSNSSKIVDVVGEDCL